MNNDPAVEFHENIAKAWGDAHALAEQLHGADMPGHFTGERGNRLMAALEALPLDSPPGAFVDLCEAHVRGTARPAPDAD